MAYTPNNNNGQATSDNSAPVVLSSNQSPSLVTQDDTIVLLSRILKTLESLTIVDSAQRARITIDSITSGLTLTTVSNVTAITNALPAGGNAIGSVTVSSGTITINAIPAGANVIGSINNLATIAGMDREMYINQARTAYNTGLRTKIN
jgi:hypothetical protein